MPIIASDSSRTFTPHPAGAFPGTCVDVHDLGVIEVTFQGRSKQQHKVDVYFFCGQWGQKDNGERFPLTVRKRFTLTLNEQGNLRPFLESWRGKKFTKEELRGFDLEVLIGAPAFLQVSHNETEKGTFANIDVIMRIPQGQRPPGIPEGFVRMKDRKAEEAKSADPYADYQAPSMDEIDPSLPF